MSVQASARMGDFNRRDDLCVKGQTRVMLCEGFGYLIKTGKRWWASKDQRTHRVGFQPNDELMQPTVGPFKTAKDALDAYNTAIEA